MCSRSFLLVKLGRHEPLDRPTGPLVRPCSSKPRFGLATHPSITARSPRPGDFARARTKSETWTCTRGPQGRSAASRQGAPVDSAWQHGRVGESHTRIRGEIPIGGRHSCSDELRGQSRNLSTVIRAKSQWRHPHFNTRSFSACAQQRTQTRIRRKPSTDNNR